MKVYILVSLVVSLLAFEIAWSADENIEAIGEENISDEVERLKEEEASIAVGDVTVFSRLDTFDDIVVLQRRFLPKKERFEGSISLGFLADNPFFVTSVLHYRMGYSFSEAFGVELGGYKANTSESQVTKNLLENGFVASNISSVPKSYLGAAVKWTPIYGKIAFFNETIIPIDNYYLLGVGKTTLINSESPTTMHFAGGLSFALKKWLAVRFEVGLYAYSSESTGALTDAHFNIGLSSFFPEATYR